MALSRLKQGFDSPWERQDPGSQEPFSESDAPFPWRTAISSYSSSCASNRTHRRQCEFRIIIEQTLNVVGGKDALELTSDQNRTSNNRRRSQRSLCQKRGCLRLRCPASSPVSRLIQLCHL